MSFSIRGSEIFKGGIGKAVKWFALFTCTLFVVVVFDSNIIYVTGHQVAVVSYPV